MANDSKKDDAVQQAMTAFAEHLGWFLGTVRSKADGVLENEELVKQVNRIRDGATDLLSRVKQAGDVAKAAATKAATKAPAKPPAQPAVKAKSAAKTARSGGAVDAPGKRHRKPPPQETLNKGMGAVRGKQAGQKQFKVGKSRGRG